MKNDVIKNGFKNTLYVIGAQSISLLLGIVRTLMLPILLGKTNFGYWQIYLLYMSYVGIFALGFNDGIYLKYGKYEYDELPKKVFRSSIKLFVIFQVVLMLIILAFVMFEPNYSKQLAMYWALFNIPIAGLTGVLIYVYQITNQLKKYSFYTILDKIIVLLFIIGVYLLKLENFIIIVIADTFSRALVLILMVYSCRDIIFGRGVDYQSALKETIDNIRIGIKLMLANFAGMLVLGFGRFLVERTATVEDYGIYSFAISTMNLVLVLINAIGLVVYPTLSRLDEKYYPQYFIKFNNFLVVIVFGMLVAVFPLKIFIAKFMVGYIEIFDYLAVVFAIIFVQSKVQMLINPYYKLLRKENLMLRSNIIGVVMAIILIVPFYIITKSITMVAIGTLIAMLIRLYLSELYLKKELKISGNINIVIELVGVLLFIILGSFNNWYVGLLIYSLIYIFVLFKFSKDIQKLVKTIFKR